jgi:hypothetical protein
MKIRVATVSLGFCALVSIPLREDRERGAIAAGEKAQYQKMTPSEKAE